MQHRYVADVGDYFKLALLRKLAPAKELGIVWWLFPDEPWKKDGRHVDYLQKTEWRKYDCDLFDALNEIISNGERNIAALEAVLAFLKPTFFSEVVSSGRSERENWLSRAIKMVDHCDLVFLDPDNGLEPATFSKGAKKAGKWVAYDELAAFRKPGRTVVVYHHQTRAKGGHMEEIRNLSARLGESFERVDAFRASPYSPRVFFLLDASDEVLLRAEELCDWWKGKMTLNPHIFPLASQDVLLPG